MLVFRSLTLGLLGACFMLLLARPTEIRVVRQVSHPTLRIKETAAPTIIDVAAGVTNAQLAAMLRLAPGEYVATIDDAPVDGNIGAGVALASRSLASRHFIDIGLAGPAGERRVLVLLH